MIARKCHIIILFLMFAFHSCHRSYTPRPRGYLRLEFPEKKYTLFDSTCPYRFEYPVYARIVADTDDFSEPCWINIFFPDFDGTIHISYKDINGNLDRFLEDSHDLAYKHTIMADAIQETVYNHPENNVHGILYDIKGNAASNIQFFLTDSNVHFLRGSLYFNVEPEKDSLAPVIAFFKEDIVHLMESFDWK